MLFLNINVIPRLANFIDAINYLIAAINCTVVHEQDCKDDELWAEEIRWGYT